MIVLLQHVDQLQGKCTSLCSEAGISTARLENVQDHSDIYTNKIQ